jgi:transcriptional regulator with XRE-family HTH domain
MTTLNLRPLPPTPPDNSTPESVGRLLRHFRETGGFTLDDVAEEVGCSRNTIGRVERGERDDHDGLTARLAFVLGRMLAAGRRL